MRSVYEIFLSEIVDRPVFNYAGEKLGKMFDLLVASENTFPTISHIILRNRGSLYSIPFEQFQVFNATSITTKENFDMPDKPMEIKPQDILLKKDLFDRQIMDMNGVKVIRVNDLKLGMAEGKLHLLAVDTGIRGILRRLGLKGRKQPSRLWKFVSHRFPYELISWEYIQPIEPKLNQLTLKVSRQKLSDLHPADIASILSQIPQNNQIDILTKMDIETAAETLHEMEQDTQVSLIEQMTEEHAADILEEMPPDKAADLLGDMNEEKAKEIIEHMDDEDAEDVQELLVHEDDTAGGLMTTEFLSVYPDDTALEVLSKLNKHASELETVYVIYVIDRESHLIGVFSLRELLANLSEKPVRSFMNDDVKSVSPDEHQKDVAELLSKYNLMAVPVADAENKILGIITFDDILDILVPHPARVKRKRR
jgi:CBS domain-containing protein/sporulation protein YlmC with PRC-barrel domain